MIKIGQPIDYGELNRELSALKFSSTSRAKEIIPQVACQGLSRATPFANTHDFTFFTEKLRQAFSTFNPTQREQILFLHELNGDACISSLASDGTDCTKLPGKIIGMLLITNDLVDLKALTKIVTPPEMANLPLAIVELRDNKQKLHTCLSSEVVKIRDLHESLRKDMEQRLAAIAEPIIGDDSLQRLSFKKEKEELLDLFNAYPEFLRLYINRVFGPLPTQDKIYEKAHHEKRSALILERFRNICSTLESEFQKLLAEATFTWLVKQNLITVDDLYPAASQLTLKLDNFTTKSLACLIPNFTPEEFEQLASEFAIGKTYIRSHNIGPNETGQLHFKPDGVAINFADLLTLSSNGHTEQTFIICQLNRFADAFFDYQAVRLSPDISQEQSERQLFELAKVRAIIGGIAEPIDQDIKETNTSNVIQSLKERYKSIIIKLEALSDLPGAKEYAAKLKILIEKGPFASSTTSNSKIESTIAQVELLESALLDQVMLELAINTGLVCPVVFNEDGQNLDYISPSIELGSLENIVRLLTDNKGLTRENLEATGQLVKLTTNSLFLTLLLEPLSQGLNLQTYLTSSIFANLKYALEQCNATDKEQASRVIKRTVMAAYLLSTQRMLPAYKDLKFCNFNSASKLALCYQDLVIKILPQVCKLLNLPENNELVLRWQNIISANSHANYADLIANDLIDWANNCKRALTSKIDKDRNRLKTIKPQGKTKTEHAEISNLVTTLEKLRADIIKQVSKLHYVSPEQSFSLCSQPDQHLIEDAITESGISDIKWLDKLGADDISQLIGITSDTGIELFAALAGYYELVQANIKVTLPPLRKYIAEVKAKNATLIAFSATHATSELAPVYIDTDGCLCFNTHFASIINDSFLLSCSKPESETGDESVNS